MIAVNTTMKGAMAMILKNAFGKTNRHNRQGACLRNAAMFLLPVLSVCGLQAWATEEQGLVLQGSAPGATNVLDKSGIYTVSGDSTTLGALQVAASPVTFDFSANPSHKVVFDGTAPDDVFSVRTKKANVVFNGGEWDAQGTGSIYCGKNDSDYGENNVSLYNCVWTNLNRVYVARNVKKCVLTLDGNSRVYAQRCFLMYSGSLTDSELNVLGGSGLYLSSSSTAAFNTDNAEGPDNGKITVSGEGSTIDVRNNQFVVGNKSKGHLLVVSNNASVVAKTLTVGNALTSTGSQVLVADNATLTATSISLRSLGGSVTISNNAEVAADNFVVGYFPSQTEGLEVMVADKANLNVTKFSITNSVGCKMTVSGEATISADTFVVGEGNDVNTVGSKVLIADGSRLTAKKITIRNPGCGMTVSNATLAVDSLKVGGAARNGGLFVLSGSNANLDCRSTPEVDVFASGATNAEFRIENGASWNLGITLRSAITATNSVFRIAGGNLCLRESSDDDDGTGTLDFGPGTSKSNPAFSVGNRFEVCDGGTFRLRRIRLNGHGNEFVVSNATVTFDTESNSENQIRLGYKAPKWTDDSWVNMDCALVLKGRRPSIVAPQTELRIDQNSVLRFEIPAEGYDSIPLHVNKFNGSNGRIEVDCEAFMHKGGKLTLATVEADKGLTSDAANALIETARETLPEGCTLTVENKSLVLRCPRRRFVFSIR